MRFAADPKTAAWLGALAGGTEDFEWDEGNRTKNRKHGIEAGEIEQLFRHEYVLEGRVVEPPHEEPRWLALGRDDRGRRLALVFTRRGDRLRPISCRPMRRKERRRYEEAISGQEGDPGASGA